MTSGETASYLVVMTLTNGQGELPDDRGVEKLIADQMSGELDDTGLFCASARVIRNLTTEL